jgi:hypothetical protein
LVAAAWSAAKKLTVASPRKVDVLVIAGLSVRLPESRVVVANVQTMQGPPALTCAVAPRRELLRQQGDLAVREGELPLDRARERGMSRGGHTRLLVHTDESITESPARLSP